MIRREYQVFRVKNIIILKLKYQRFRTVKRSFLNFMDVETMTLLGINYCNVDA